MADDHALPDRLRPLAENLFIALVQSGRSIGGDHPSSPKGRRAMAQEAIRLAVAFDKQATLT